MRSSCRHLNRRGVSDPDGNDPAWVRDLLNGCLNQIAADDGNLELGRPRCRLALAWADLAIHPPDADTPISGERESS
jgi:hypothetical protein